MTPLPAGHLAGSGERSAFEEGARHPRRIVRNLIDKEVSARQRLRRDVETPLSIRPDSKELQQQDREAASGDHAIDVDVTRAEPPVLEILKLRRSGRSRRLLDLSFAKLDVFFRDRVVFLLDELVGHRPRILARHVVEAGIGARHELNFDRCGFGHDRTLKSLRLLTGNLFAGR
jgi:hypothetical protein